MTISFLLLYSVFFFHLCYRWSVNKVLWYWPMNNAQESAINLLITDYVDALYIHICRMQRRRRKRSGFPTRLQSAQLWLTAVFDDETSSSDSKHKTSKLKAPGECKLMPNTHRRRDETVLSRRRRRCEHNSQLAHDDCRRIRSTVWKLAKQTP